MFKFLNSWLNFKIRVLNYGTMWKVLSQGIHMQGLFWLLPCMREFSRSFKLNERIWKSMREFPFVSKTTLFFFFQLDLHFYKMQQELLHYSLRVACKYFFQQTSFLTLSRVEEVLLFFFFVKKKWNCWYHDRGIVPWSGYIPLFEPRTKMFMS